VDGTPRVEQLDSWTLRLGEACRLESVRKLPVNDEASDMDEAGNETEGDLSVSALSSSTFIVDPS
jgi:hypothetical protein